MTEFISTASLHMEWSSMPWDAEVVRFPVLHISRMKVRGPGAGEDIKGFETIRDKSGVGLVSCRLPHDYLAESMLLEERGFRFIEMIYQPELALDTKVPSASDDFLVVSRAGEDDLPALLKIAGTAFVNERFYVDPLLGPTIGDQRYRNWVKNSFCHHSQDLYVLRDDQRLVAFFITELLDEGTCYWHLNAVAPDAQGQGYGRRAWLTMLRQAAMAGAKRVCTSIVARNHRVLNLYARLGFKFLPPLMTFHWVRTGDR